MRTDHKQDIQGQPEVKMKNTAVKHTSFGQILEYSRNSLMAYQENQWSQTPVEEN